MRRTTLAVVIGAHAVLGLWGTGLHVMPTRQVANGPAACAVSVTPYLNGSDRTDDTAAFRAAMSAASSTQPRCFAAGPSGAPQAVVYVPPGTYRLSNLTFPSNLRLEVDAAATMQLPANRPAVPSQTWTPMIMWDAPATAAPLSNVSIVGVGRSASSLKTTAVAGSASRLSGFDIAGYFTMNLDPQATGATNYETGVNLVNVHHFLIANVFSIQNDAPAPAASITPWPTSARAVLELYSRRDSPVDGAIYDPQDGLIENQVNVGSPRGYGPNQVNSARRVTFSNIYSRGGTTLRLETDGSTSSDGTPQRAARVDAVIANGLVGENCNRVVSFSPHAQHNGSVLVRDAMSYGCLQGVVSAIDPHLAKSRVGSFSSAVVQSLTAIAGPRAQHPSPTPTQLWTVGPSMMPVYIGKGVTWRTTVEHLTTSGTFTHWPPR